MMKCTWRVSLSLLSGGSAMVDARCLELLTKAIFTRDDDVVSSLRMSRSFGGPVKMMSVEG